MRLTDDYQYESEKEKEEKQQTSTISHKKESPKKPTKDDLSEINKWVNEKETGINSEVFQRHFKFQRSSDIQKTNDKNKNSKLVNLIKSGLNDFKNEIENMGEEEKEIEKPNEMVNIVEKFLSLTNKIKQDKD